MADEYDDLEKEMQGGKKAKRAKAQRKPTPPPLPSDSPMRQVVTDDLLGTRLVLPPGEPPTKDELARQKEVLDEAAGFHEALTGVETDFRAFLSGKVAGNQQLTVFQRAWLDASGFQLRRALEFLGVAMRGKV